MKLEVRRIRVIERSVMALSAIVAVIVFFLAEDVSMLVRLMLAAAAWGITNAWLLTAAVKFFLPAARDYIIQEDHEYDGMLTHKYTSTIKITGNPILDGFLKSYAQARTLAGISAGGIVVLALMFSCTAML